MGWRIMMRMFLKMIAARASSKGYFVDISRVYGKPFAHLQTTFIVNTALPLRRQQRTNKNERTASSTLMALPFSYCQLFLHIPLSEVNQVKSSELPHHMDHEANLLKDLQITFITHN